MKILSGIVVFLFVCIANPVHAVLVDGKDWMQVTATTGYSWNDFDAIFDTTTGLCDLAECLLGGTIDLTGYTWASNADVDSLIQSFNGGVGLSYLTTSNAVYYPQFTLDEFFGNFEKTWPLGDTGNVRQLIGVTRNQSSSSEYADYIGVNQYLRDIAVGDDMHLLVVGDLTVTASGDAFGGWLYKTAVPEPGTFFLLSIGLAGIAFSRRKQVLNMILREPFAYVITEGNFMCFTHG